MAKKLQPPKPKKRLLLSILYVLIVVLVFSFGVYYFVRYNQVNDKYQAAIMTEDQKNQQYVDKVAKLYNVPKYDQEKPTVFAITDTTKLADTQAVKKFFAGAVKDDIVMVYQNADLSIIYRPSENKIIRTDNYANALAATNTYKIALIAPTEQQEAVLQKIQSTFGNISVVGKQAPSVPETQSYVADASGSNPKAAKELADKLGLSVGQLSEGETKIEGATLIVVIANQVVQ